MSSRDSPRLDNLSVHIRQHVFHSASMLVVLPAFGHARVPGVISAAGAACIRSRQSAGGDLRCVAYLSLGTLFFFFSMLGYRLLSPRTMPSLRRVCFAVLP